MNVGQKASKIRQIDEILAGPTTRIRTPEIGWVKELRTLIGMSGRQLARRLGVTPQTADELEEAELHGSITIARLRRAAEALDCRLVYALVPKQGTVNALIRERAEAIASRLVAEDEAKATIEDPARDAGALRDEIAFRAAALARQPSRRLWDEIL